MSRPAKTPKEFRIHFSSLIDFDGDCWCWKGQRDKKGYGRIWKDGKKKAAHRVSWELVNDDPIPDGMHVCHRCDNPPCVRPSHLFLGTHSDNMKDCAKKGRNVLIVSPDLWRRGKDHWTRSKTKKAKTELKKISDNRKLEWSSGRRVAIRDSKGRIMGTRMVAND